MITEAEPFDWVYDLKLTTAEAQITCVLLSEDRRFQRWELCMRCERINSTTGSEKVLIHHLRKKLGGYDSIESLRGWNARTEGGYRLSQATRHRLLNWKQQEQERSQAA